MVLRFNPPPNWPKPPEGFTPGPGWSPDPSWGAGNCGLMTPLLRLRVFQGMILRHRAPSCPMHPCPRLQLEPRPPTRQAEVGARPARAHPIVLGRMLLCSKRRQRLWPHTYEKSDATLVAQFLV